MNNDASISGAPARAHFDAHRLDYLRPIFVERQRVDRPLYWIIIVPIVIALLVLAVFAARDAMRATGVHRVGALFGTGLILATAVALALLVALGNLTVTVTNHQLAIRYFLLLAAIRRRIPIDEIASVRAETYEPMREFLGWGIKWSQRDSTTAYSVSGNRGVRIQLRSGEKLLIGSNRADELAAAIEEARGSARGSAT